MEQDMKYIYQVYLDGSISKAADTLYLTQPALSIAVKRVETSLGAELFDRSRHPLELTEAGQAYIAAVHRMQHLESDLVREVEDLRRLRTGTLRIGGTHYLNCYLLAGVLADFSKEYPGIQIHLMEDSSVKLAAALKRREVDMILSCAPEMVDQFEHRPAFYDHVLLAVPHSASLSPELKTAALSAEDILSGQHLHDDCPKAPLSLFRDVEYILLGPGNNLHDRSLQMLAEAGFTPKVKLTLSQLVTAFHMANNGLGATFISDRLIRNPTSHLSYFKIDSQLATRLFYILLPERNYTPFAVREFVEYAIRKIALSDEKNSRCWSYCQFSNKA